ncbi:MAG: thiazole synthase, partial [bacterium]|nr:thiazole synthase [bacterium]
KAGRMGYLSGLPGVSQVAAASSPLTGFLHA